jgi:aspartate/methionine/tyrosine aminotransferase
MFLSIQDYQSKRDYIIKLLAGVGFKIQFIPQGSFFLFAELPEDCPLSDVCALFHSLLNLGLIHIRTILIVTVHLSKGLSIILLILYSNKFFGLQVEFVKKLILEAGVVAVPGQGFFHTNLSSDEVSNASCNYQKRFIRFAFCKSEATLSAASEKLGKLLDAEGHLALH